MYKLPEKSHAHISIEDRIKYSDNLDLVPGRTPTEWGHTIRHRTRLEHPCWFSKKAHIKKLSVIECIQKHPKYMVWVYKNLNINWSVYAIEKLEKLVEHVESTESAIFQWLAR